MKKILSVFLSVIATCCLLVGLTITTHTAKAEETSDFCVAKVSIRLAPSEDNGNGIRFAILMKKTMYINYAKDGCELGALILPTDLVPKTGLNKDTALVKKVVTYGDSVDSDSKDVSKWIDCNIDGYSDYMMSVVYLWGIPEGSYNRPVTVVGYAKNESDEYVYSTSMSKSLAEVALAEYKATENVNMQEYLQTFNVEFYDGDNQKITQGSYSYTFGDSFVVPSVAETKGELVFDGWQEYVKTVDNVDVYSDELITDFTDMFVKYSTKYKAHYGRVDKTLTDSDVLGSGYVSDFDNENVSIVNSNWITEIPAKYESTQNYFLDFVLDKANNIYNVDLTGFNGISYKANASYYNTITIKGYTDGDVSNWLLLPMNGNNQIGGPFNPIITKNGNLTTIKYFFMGVPNTQYLRLFSGNGNAELYVTEVGYKAETFSALGTLDTTATKVIVPQICDVDDFNNQAESIIILDRGHVAVIDAGDEKSESTKFVLVNELRELGVTKIDTLILTHPHSDHTGAMPILIENFDVERFYYKNTDYATRNAQSMATSLNKVLTSVNNKTNSDASKIAVIDPQFGETYKLVDNSGANDGVLTFYFNQKVFNSSNEVDGNYYSMSINYAVGENNILYAGGDLPDEYTSVYADYYDEDIFATAEKVAIWQVNHHGSNGPYSSTFLIDKLRPDYVIGMGSEDNIKQETRNKISQYAGNADIYYARYGAEFTVDVSNGSVTANTSYTHENGDDNFRYLAKVTNSEVNREGGATVNINEYNIDTSVKTYLDINYVNTIADVDESGTNRYLYAKATAMPSALKLYTFKNIFTTGNYYKLTLVMTNVTSTAKFHVLFQNASGQGLLDPSAFTVKAIDDKWSEYSVVFKAVEGLSYLELFDYDNYQTTAIRTEFYLKSISLKPADEYSVTFYDYDGSVIDSKSVTEGTSVVITDPEKLGFTFGGWDSMVDGIYTGLNFISSNAVNQIIIDKDYEFKAVYYPTVTKAQVENGYTLDFNEGNLYTVGGYYNDITYTTVNSDRFLRVSKTKGQSVSALALRSFSDVFTGGEKYEIRIKATSSSSLGGIILQENATNSQVGTTSNFSTITEGDYKIFISEITADSALSYLLIFCNNTSCNLDIKSITIRKVIYATKELASSEDGLTINANNLAYTTANYISTQYNDGYIKVAQTGNGADFRFKSTTGIFDANSAYIITYTFRNAPTIGQTFLSLRMNSNDTSNGSATINKVSDNVYRSYVEGYDGMAYLEIFMAGAVNASFELESINIKKVGSVTYTAENMTVRVNGTSSATKGVYSKNDCSILPETSATYYKVDVAYASNIMFEDFRGLLKTSNGYTITIKAYVVGGTSHVSQMHLGTIGSSTNANSIANPMMKLQEDGSYILSISRVTASNETVIGIFGTGSETLYIEWIKVDFLGATTNVKLTSEGGTVDFTQNQSTTFNAGTDGNGNYNTMATIGCDQNGTKALHVVRQATAGYYLAFTDIELTNGATYKFTFTAKGFNIDTVYLAGITGNIAGRSAFQIDVSNVADTAFDYSVTFTASTDNGMIQFYNQQAYARDFYIYKISLEKLA